MSNKDLEELIYEYGEVMKHIGRCETDGKTGMKEYSKLVSEKEKIKDQFDHHFQVNTKLSRSLGMS
jgi:hypothetical protein